MSENLPLPPATEDHPGVITVGDNIEIDSGRISVPHATEKKCGVLKLPSNWLSNTVSVGLVGVDMDGNLFDNSASYVNAQAGQQQYQLSTIFDVIYPVGSVYVSMTDEPPFKNGLPSLGIQCIWKKIDSNCTLWSSAASELPDSIASTTDPAASQHYVTETLPKLPPMQCVAAGAHTHYGKFPSYVLASSHGRYGYAGSPTSSPAYIDKENLKTTSDGSHTHSVSYTSALPSAYQDNASVRPRGFKCSMWVRVA